MRKRFCNFTNRTTYWSDFLVKITVEIAQELHEKLEKVTYMLCTCVAGMPVEKL